MKINKYSIGDLVEIINYGQLMWINKTEPYWEKLKGKAILENDETIWIDLRPELVGEKGKICQVKLTQKKWKYSIAFSDIQTISWFSEKQLKHTTNK